jgi:ATP-binding cassette subfamily B protein
MPSIKGNIRFEDVRFRFGKKGPYQVDRVNLSISASSFVGIVGQSGSGKSTLTKLIPRLYQLDEGRIFIDDYDVAKVNLSSLRRQIGIVPQDSLLFEGTVAENIALNDPQASTEAIINAAKIACAHDFIMSLGQGYATPLAERGGNLSGGQRQRIAIARTILANPQLLVMDEATSALDYNTERQLCMNLQSWAAGRTVLFITHRLSSIRNSDVILVMHEGHLVEQGTHSELMQAGERYATLYQQQGD